MCKIENSTDGKSEKRQTKQQQNADKYQRSSGCVRTKLHLNLYICLQHRIKFYIFCIVTTAPTERRRGFFQLELVCKHYIRQCFTVEPAGTDYAWKTENTPLAAHQTHTNTHFVSTHCTNHNTMYINRRLDVLSFFWLRPFWGPYLNFESFNVYFIGFVIEL